MTVAHTSPLGGQLWKPGAVAPSIVGGKTYTPAASYPSSSDPKKRYTVCEVNDGTTSCDCMAWTRRNPPGGRTCKHTQDYETYLRHLWGTSSTPTRNPEPVIQTAEKEKGGSLAKLFAKLEKQEEAKP